MKKKITVTWTAMKLFHAPNSLKVGCGQTSNCLLALDKHPTGEETETYTQKNTLIIRETNRIWSFPLPVWVVTLCFVSASPHHLWKTFLCKTQSQPGSSLALVCQEPMVRIQWLKSVLCFSCTCLTSKTSCPPFSFAMFHALFVSLIVCFKVSVWLIH